MSRTKVRRAGVERAVNAMADAHDFLLLGESVFDVGIDIGRAADFLEHFYDAFIRATVEWTLQGADRGGDSGIHVAQGGDGDAGTES